MNVSSHPTNVTVETLDCLTDVRATMKTAVDKEGMKCVMPA